MADIRDYEPLWGAWKVESVIGEGSFGKVYKVSHEEFGAQYYAAAKMISVPSHQEDVIRLISEGMDESSILSYYQGFVQDILQEIDMMERFKGTSNIVCFEDYRVVEKTDGVGYDILIRMELLKSLTKILAERSLSAGETIQLGADICKALELCVKYNTIHRDIKPDNIFISAHGDYKLGDFGVARQTERAAAEMSKKGTSAYMAPEVYKGERYSASVDIYSLGLVLYRLLNRNRAPFMPSFPEAVTPQDRESALACRMRGETLPPLKGVSKELSDIILKACAYKEQDRFANPRELREALENLPESARGQAEYEPVSDEPDEPHPHSLASSEEASEPATELTKTIAPKPPEPNAFPAEIVVMPVPVPDIVRNESKDPPKPGSGLIHYQIQDAPQIIPHKRKKTAQRAGKARVKSFWTKDRLRFIISSGIVIAVFSFVLIVALLFWQNPLETASSDLRRAEKTETASASASQTEAAQTVTASPAAAVIAPALYPSMTPAEEATPVPAQTPASAPTPTPAPEPSPVLSLPPVPADTSAPENNRKPTQKPKPSKKPAETSSPEAPPRFADINGYGSAVQKAINAITDAGVMEGTSDTAFSPGDPLTKETLQDAFRRLTTGKSIDTALESLRYDNSAYVTNETLIGSCAKVLISVMHYQNPAEDVDYFLGKYLDSSEISEWAKEDIAFAIKMQLLTASPDSRIYPQERATRANGAVLLYQLRKFWTK